jgi:hypothetical protein
MIQRPATTPAKSQPVRAANQPARMKERGMTYLKSVGLAFTLALSQAGSASAEVVRCELTQRSDSLMPAWIEYEINSYGTSVAVRDELGARFGVDWVAGEITENTPRRFALIWNIGELPKQEGWRQSGRIEMRLIRLPNGSVQISGTPTALVYSRESYSGRAQCSG